MKYVSYDICMSEKAPFYIRNGAFSFLFDKSIRGQKCNIFLQDFSPNMFEHVHHQLQNVTSKIQHVRTCKSNIINIFENVVSCWKESPKISTQNFFICYSHDLLDSTLSSSDIVLQQKIKNRKRNLLQYH